MTLGQESWALVDLARAEEARAAAGAADVADESRPFAAGVAARGAPGSWTNAIYGAGLDGTVTRDALRDVVSWYEASGIEPRIELCPFADRTLVDGLAAERFVLRSFEMVFVHELGSAASIGSPVPEPAGLSIEAVDKADAAMLDVFARTAISGFLPEGEPIPQAFVDTALRSARHPRVTSIVARLDGDVVGAGSIVVAPPTAGLFGVTVVKHARRRGVQLAMLAWRLRHAAACGARWATIGGRPGEATERNARRIGFQPAYTKVILVRPGPGLVPVTE